MNLGTKIAICALVIFGIGGLNKTLKNNNAGSINKRIQALSPVDFFPTDTNHRFVYNIKTFSENNAPLKCQLLFCDSPDLSTENAVNRKFALVAPANQENKLILKIVGQINKKEDEGQDKFRLLVERDDLKIYKNVTELYWSVDYGAVFNIYQTEVITGNIPEYHKLFLNSYGISGKTYVSNKYVFFGGKRGYSLTFPFGIETITFVDFEPVNDVPCLHFQRSVPKTGNSYIDSAFTEEIWFAKDLGLIKLVQTVNGKITMTWDLE